MDGPGTTYGPPGTGAYCTNSKEDLGARVDDGTIPRGGFSRKRRAARNVASPDNRESKATTACLLPPRQFFSVSILVRSSCRGM